MTHPPKKLTGISPLLFQHPSDRAILAKLEAVPLLPGMVGKLLDVLKEQMELELLANSFHVTADSLSNLHTIYQRVCATLCVDKPPPLYVAYSPGYNAYTMGVDEAFIVVHSSMVTDFSDAELAYVLGHELGHVMSGHLKYQTLVRLIGGNVIVQMDGLTKIVSNAVFGPLLYLWARRAEYTCDRVGLLACQDIHVAHQANFRMAGCPRQFIDSLSPDTLVKQAIEFNKRVEGSLISRVFAGANQIFRTHPRIIERSAELKNWVDEGWFDDIVNGNETTRRKMAEQLDADPQTAEMTLLVIQNVINCAANEFKMDRSKVAPLIRRAILGGETLKDTALERILRIELAINKEGSDKVRYSVCFLLNKGGQPVAQRFKIMMPGNWDDTPSELRKAFIKQNTDTIVNVLYSV